MIVSIHAYTQTGDSTVHTKSLSTKVLSKIEQQVITLNTKIKKKTFKTLQQLQKQEANLQSKLSLKDSLAATQLFDGNNTIKAFTQKLAATPTTNALTEYIPSLDSLQTGLSFLNQTKSLQDKFPKEWSSKLTNVHESIAGMQSSLQQVNEVKRFIQERKQLLKAQLEKYGMAKELKKLNKQVYYYHQQINEYKDILKNPQKIQKKAIAALRTIPAFSEFMKKNSQLAQLFPLPDNYGTPEALAGLQTRASVQSALQTRFASTGTNPQQYLQQQMSQAQGELNKLKDKINKAGGGSSDIEMPDFTPNSQKTKSFLKRLELGGNVQSQKTNMLLPVTSDLALTAGYKLNDKSVIGIGASYKLGWGSGWKDIRLTSEGIGLRSYVDIKLKGNIWITGGYEQNYQSGFTKIEQLKNLDAWQTSGLLGLMKKYKIGKKINNMQVLWDFLSYQQVPRRQPVLFRVGYTLK